jgi:V8-like Glu-specific endopeptidase
MMRTLRAVRRFLICCCASALLSFMHSAYAAEVSAQDASHVRAVVQAQLEAFSSGDAAKAFSLAAPGIQQMFGSAERFMSMVRAQYPMVHRAASVSFLRPEAEGDMVMQRVQVTDTAGSPWLVTYLVQRQKDKRWRIGACVVVAGTHRLTT